ncbi:hypothetical protein HDU76_004484 [Blyttiomyces sp. JEL0837]|nr:hypothetical protein HDU76_004484 [Blyttiomyces sp. JEL0837]
MPFIKAFSQQQQQSSSASSSASATPIPPRKPGLSFEDVVPYYTNVNPKNVIAILIDQSKQSEQAFESVIENIVPGYDPVDTQFLLISAQLPVVPSLTSSNDKYGPRQATRDLLAQRTLQLYKASSINNLSEIDLNDNIPSSKSFTSEIWYGHVRSIFYRSDIPEEFVSRLSKFNITMIILALNQTTTTSSTTSVWQFSHNVSRLLLSSSLNSVPVKKVGGDPFSVGDGFGRGDEVVYIRRGIYEEVIGDRGKVDGGSNKLKYMDRFVQAFSLFA